MNYKDIKNPELIPCSICGEYKVVKEEHGMLSAVFEFEEVCQDCVETLGTEPEPEICPPEQCHSVGNCEGTGKDSKNMNLPF